MGAARLFHIGERAHGLLGRMAVEGVDAEIGGIRGKSLDPAVRGRRFGIPMSGVEAQRTLSVAVQALRERVPFPLFHGIDGGVRAVGVVPRFEEHLVLRAAAADEGSELVLSALAKAFFIAAETENVHARPQPRFLGGRVARNAREADPAVKRADREPDARAVPLVRAHDLGIFFLRVVARVVVEPEGGEDVGKECVLVHFAVVIFLGRPDRPDEAAHLLPEGEEMPEPAEEEKEKGERDAGESPCHILAPFPLLLRRLFFVFGHGTLLLCL